MINRTINNFVYTRKCHLGDIHFLSKIFMPKFTKYFEDVKFNNEQMTDMLLDKGLVTNFSSGFMGLLPTFTRSIKKLINLIDNEMQSIGAQKVILPSIYKTKFLELSGRLDTFDNEIFKINTSHDDPMFLAPTHEEAITKIIGNGLPLTTKQLPLLLYQIDSKFRNEKRPRFGLFRTKQFLMKDMYSFDLDKENARKTYDKVCHSYSNIFKLLDIPVYKVVASNGLMGGEFSHEYHIESKNGEDSILSCINCDFHYNKEAVQDSKNCFKCKLPMVERKGIEVGHTFYLADKYSKTFNAQFIDNKKLNYLEMCCFGLGVTRILASVLDYLSSKKNLSWPIKLAPYHIYIVTPKKGSKENTENYCDTLALQLAQSLQQIGLDILIDDREKKTIGFKINDGLSLGIPYVVVVGKNATLDTPNFELLTNNLNLMFNHRELLEYFKKLQI